MARQRVLALAAALLSAGWIVPLLLGVEAYLSFWQSEVWPLLLQEAHPASSFPHLAFAAQCFRVALAWLGAVVLFWSYIGCTALARGRAA